MLNGLYMQLVLKIYLDTLKWVVIKQLAAVGNMKKVGNKKRKFVSVHENAQKKELGQHQATLTSDLVNNVYMLFKGIIWKHRWYHCGVP